MAVYSSGIELETRGHAQVIDVTEQVAEHVRSSGLTSGIGCVFAPGATGGVTTIEYEQGCVDDLKRLFDEIAPPDRDYEHHRRWGDGNGHSHLRSALLGPSLSFPFADRKPTLGTWQQIVFVDFDNRPRSRRILVQLVGE